MKKGKEPASQTVLSFFADPGFDEFEMHRARAAAAVLNIRLREILREELGGTYGVYVGFTNSPPIKGYGTMVIQFGSSPDNVDKLVAASLKEIERLKTEGPSAGRCQQGEGARAPRPRNQREAELLLAGLDADRAHATAGIRPASRAAASAPSG